MNQEIKGNEKCLGRKVKERTGRKSEEAKRQSNQAIPDKGMPRNPPGGKTEGKRVGTREPR